MTIKHSPGTEPGEEQLVGPDRTLRNVETSELLGEYARILQELRSRGVVRTANAPLGDYAEYLALSVYGGELAPNSAKSYDIRAADAAESPDSGRAGRSRKGRRRDVAGGRRGGPVGVGGAACVRGDPILFSPRRQPRRTFHRH